MEAVIDQPTEELVDDLVVEDQTAENPDKATEGGKETAPVVEEKVDGRKFNPEWSKALKELREQYPDRADMLTKLRDTYGRYGALTEIAPKGLDDVKQWKTTLDALGGSEAAAEMMQRVATMEQVDAKIEAGDFSVIDDLPETLQKGFYGMIPDALSTLQEKDPAAYEKAVMPHFAAALAGSNMGEHLKQMYAKADGNAELQALIKQQFDWFQNNTQGKGASPGATRTVDPQVTRLQAEIDAGRKRDDDAFIQGVTDNTNKYVGEAFTKNAEVYLKQFGLTDAQKSDLMDSFAAKLVDKLGADKAFQTQLGAYKSLKNRSAETVNNYIRGKVDENAKPIIDGLVAARYGGMRKKTAATATATVTTDNGSVRVAKAPDQSEWDMAKMQDEGYERTAKVGKYYLKGGRMVQVVRQ